MQLSKRGAENDFAAQKQIATDCVYQAIRQDIVAGRYAEGEHLTEIRLGEELGVSRTPIRAALQRLSADGFLKLTSHSGAVMKGSVRDAAEIFQIRAHLESLAGLAAQRAKETDVDQLRDLCHQMEEAAKGPDPLPMLTEQALPREDCDHER
jgi:DNA-binding GntR family transcriptional regulator